MGMTSRGPLRLVLAAGAFAVGIDAVIASALAAGRGTSRLTASSPGLAGGTAIETQPATLVSASVK
jgi:hypothetical protein